MAFAWLATPLDAVAVAVAERRKPAGSNQTAIVSPGHRPARRRRIFPQVFAQHKGERIQEARRESSSNEGGGADGSDPEPKASL